MNKLFAFGIRPLSIVVGALLQLEISHAGTQHNLESNVQMKPRLQTDVRRSD